MRSVVITGTSTGIGHGAAKVLLARGFRVFGSVRKQPDADRLKSELGANFTPLLFDVTDEAAVNAAASDVRAALHGEKLAGLVNNAGIAVAGPFLELAAADFRRQLEVNVIGPVISTKAFAPLLGAVKALGDEYPDRSIAVMLPEIVDRRWYHFFFRHRTTLLKALLLLRGGPRIILITTPWYVRASPETREYDSRESVHGESKDVIAPEPRHQGERG